MGANKKKPDIEVILKFLWAIRDKDQFYFNAYGKEKIENYVNQRLSSLLPKKQSKQCPT